MTASNRNSLKNMYEVSYQNEWSENFNHAAPSSRYALLKRLNDTQLDALYREYFASIDSQIAILKESNSPLASPAENMLAEIKFSISKEAKTSAPDSTLLNLLHTTDNLLKTPYLNEQQEINPSFIKRAENFQSTLKSINSDVKRKTLFGVGCALLAALIVAAIITLAVVTFGVFAIVAARTIMIATFSSALQLTMAGAAGVGAAGFFSNAYRLNQIAKQAEPLADILSATNNHSLRANKLE